MAISDQLRTQKKRNGKRGTFSNAILIIFLILLCLFLIIIFSLVFKTREKLIKLFFLLSLRQEKRER